MIDPVVLSKRESVERCLSQIRKYYALPSDVSFVDDYLRQDAIASNLERACQLTIDLANHTIRRKKLGLPKDSGKGFDLLHEAGLIDEDLKKKLRGMVGFRNILVHRYRELDLDLMIDVIENHLDDLLEFARIITAIFSEDPNGGKTI